MKDKLIELLEDHTSYDLRELRIVTYGDEAKRDRRLFKDGLVIEYQEHHGGGEGGGEEHWIVLKVTNGEEVTYWEVPGWYASHDGAYVEVENMFQVKPVEVVVNQWEAV